jgi:hypothetical protein
VLRGKIEPKGGGLRPFFFFSGIHDKDFPWGDEEIFWDIALIIQKDDGSWERYVLTDRMIETLKLDVEKGIYQYEGPLYQVVEGYRAAKSEMERSPLPSHLRQRQAKIEIVLMPSLILLWMYRLQSCPISKSSSRVHTGKK